MHLTPFRGDPDIDELHEFFGPEKQYDGDTRWTFGTSLKSAYVNMFDFMGHAPVVQLWRDDSTEIQAVTRLSLGTGEWFHQAKPDCRTNDVAEELAAHADQAFALLSSNDSWTTVRYESDANGIELLERAGYERDGIVEVYMDQALDSAIEPTPHPEGVIIELLDTSDAELFLERGRAQVDAFSTGEPTERENEWIARSLPRQREYGHPNLDPWVVARNDSGVILAFADVFYDRSNLVGEFEPVGTRQSQRRRGLAGAVATRGLHEMQVAGMTKAVVRTDATNVAAIATYQSVGFSVTDHLIRMRQHR